MTSSEPRLHRTKRVVYFRIHEYLSDELGHLGRLAESGDGEGIKGYLIRIGFDVTLVGDLDCQRIEEALLRLVQHPDFFRQTGG